NAFYRPIERAYMALLRWSMGHRWVIVAACALALGACGPLAKRVPKGFIPIDDQAQFEISLRTPEGTSADETALVAERVAQEVRKLPGVGHTVVTVAGGDQKTLNLASIYTAMVDPKLREVSQYQVMDLARKRVLAKLPPELRVSVGEVPAFATGTSSAAVQYVLAGPDLKQLEAFTMKMGEKIKKHPAV